MEISREQRQESLNQLNSLYKKCWSDEKFKQELVENPIPTLEKFSNKKFDFNEGIKNLVVDDQTDSNIIYLNIPKKIDVNNIELTEEELEMISGGVAPLVVYGIFAACVAIGWFAT